MAGKKKEIQLQAIITNQTQWDEMLLTKGVTVIDVYQAWCGPCKAVVNLFRKLKNEQGEDGLLHFAVAEADSIVTLQTFRDKCEPVFLFCVDCKIIAMVRGANAPLLSKTVIELLEEERKILAEEKASEITTEESQLDVGRIQNHFKGRIWRAQVVSPEKGVIYTVAIIKPDAVANGRLEDIKQKITEAGFHIAAEEEKTLTEDQEMATQFYKDHEGKPFFDQLVNYMSEGPSMVMILTKENAVEEWRQLMGPADPDIAKESSPDSIRAQFAEDILRNAVHGSSNKEHALKSIEYVF
uniref:NME/NM23 family member 8 n=1 Tax=Pelodiscus sinensis TaxID=13735 RepID=K7GFP3_PELSI